MNAVRTQDLSQNRRIARLTQLTRELEQSRTPEDTLQILERGFTEVDGFVASLLLSTRGLSPGHFRVVDAPSGLTGSRASSATAAIVLRNSSTDCARPCGRTNTAKPPEMTEPLLRRGSYRRRATVTIKIDNQHAAG